MQLDGRVMTIAQMSDHVRGLVMPWKPKFCVLHNTDTPDIALYQKWMARGNPSPEQWLKNLAAYYSGLGWHSMPHCFVLPDGRIGMGAPFTIKGTHTPSWNSVSIGVEMVGNFDREGFAGTPTENATVALFGELHNRLDLIPDNFVLGVRGIHFHKEDRATTHKNCPGKNVTKPGFVAKVAAYMGHASAADSADRNGHVHVPEAAAVLDTSALTDYQQISPWWVQLRLRELGYKLDVDGQIGTATKTIVKDFQTKHPPLVVDGIAGPATRLALKSAKGS